MSNPNKAQGLSPVQYLGGSPWNGQARTYYIPATDTSTYAIGDPVATNGTVGADANGVAAVQAALYGASNLIRGVIVGLGASETGMFDPNNLSAVTIPAAKLHPYYVMVVDDPDVLFLAQEFSGVGSTNFTALDVGLTCNLKFQANNGYQSNVVLDDTVAPSTLATGQVQLMQLNRTADNTFGNYAKFLVRINQHELCAPVAGI